MRLAFMGSPDFSVPALRALRDAGHEIAVVYCQPPRPAGRGQKETPCPVHRAALEMGLPVRTPARLRKDVAEHAFFAGLELDAAVVAAYGLILPLPMLEAPRLGCLNIHASLLPRWRGAAPIQAALLAGDAESGITIMRMEEGLDTGPMLLAEAIPLGPETTASTLHDALSAMGARLILQALEQNPAPRPQPEAGATYAAKLTKADGRLDWQQDAAHLDRQIRALNPWPGTWCLLAPEITTGTSADAPAPDAPRETLRVLAATPTALPQGQEQAAPGTVLEGGMVVCGQTGQHAGSATGNAKWALQLQRLQRPGRAALPIADFLRGTSLPPRLG